MQLRAEGRYWRLRRCVRALAALLGIASWTVGCGLIRYEKRQGSQGDDGSGSLTLPSQPVLSVEFGLKQLRFAWTEGDAEVFRLIETTSLGSESLVAEVTGDARSLDHRVAVHRQDWASRFRLEACNSQGCAASQLVDVGEGRIATIGFAKAAVVDAGDRFGHSVALSDDGTVLAVGAVGEDGGFGGVNAPATDNSAANAGAVLVFRLQPGEQPGQPARWQQEAVLKASHPDEDDIFGSDLALSGDGRTLVVGAHLEDGNGRGSNGDPSDNSAENSGAAYVFSWNAGVWQQTAYLKAPNSDPSDVFAFGVAIDADGDTLAMGAFGEDGASSGVDGNAGSNGAGTAGAAYVFAKEGDTWVPQGYFKRFPSNPGTGAQMGRSIALSADGNTLAVGASFESSDAVGIDGSGSEPGLNASGAVYVFRRSGVSWSEDAFIKASNPGQADFFGGRIALSGDGLTLVVGAHTEDSAARGVDGDQEDDSAEDAGAAYVFSRSSGRWQQEAYLKASNGEAGDRFGRALAVTASGSMIAVGAPNEDGGLGGVGADQNDNSAADAGAIYLFERVAGAWAQTRYIKASVAALGDGFGGRLALDALGDALAVGAEFNDIGQSGVGSAAAANGSVSDSGALFLY